MSSGFDEHASPLVIAHRGASAHAPENTLAAFERAVELGADGIELDTKLSADNIPVVIHDQTVDRTTGARGRVSALPVRELQALDAGSFFGPAFHGERIPTLDEVFQAVGRRILINVEITNYESPGDALPDLVAGLVERHGLQDWVLFSSFHPLNLLRVRRRLPGVPVAILAQPGLPGRLMRGWLGRLAAPRWVHPYFSDVDAAYLEREHRRGRRVSAWTVNDPGEIRRLLNLGIDGIITDDPLLGSLSSDVVSAGRGPAAPG